MIIVGHRGVAGHYPENTRVSIMAAIDLGLEWVEVDIQPTKDHQLVVCHDHTINRCSNGHGRVDQHTLKELKQLDFGDWFDKRFTGERIMTLGELLNLSKLHRLKLNLEIKVDKHDAKFVCQLLTDVLHQENVTTDNIILSSFDPDVMRQLHQMLPQYRRAVLCGRVSHKVYALLAEVAAFSCNIDHRWTSKQQIAKLQSLGYQVWSYTVNNPHRVKYLSNLDALFSDYPQRFVN